MTDHKTLAKLYLFSSLAFMAVGGMLAMAMRWQLAWPSTVVPVLGRLMPRMREQGGIMPPEIYAEFFSQHGSIMVFLVVIPLLVGGFGNYLVPLQIGARAMAFSRLNGTAFWIHATAGLVILGGFFAPGGSGASGWTAYPPLSVVGLQGQNWWITGLLLFSVAQIITAICQVTTILTNRAPGMTLIRLPMPVWSFLFTGLLTIFSTPALMLALLMLLSDRLIGTHYFVPGPQSTGQPLLWQHLFWFYAHPAVYIMILPAMGMVSELLSVFARKPLFGYKAFVASSGAIAILGFLVWGHHMFQSGMNPYLGTSFMLATFAIAVPSSLKTFNWIGTLWGGSIRFTVPLLHAAAFVSLFVIGGLSGIFLASTPVNAYLHDSYFVVAHLHYVLFGGSLFAIFGALHYWFPKMFGVMLDERVGRVHFVLTFLAFNGTFFPMHILGAGGMMRRMYDTTQYSWLLPLQPIQIFITHSAYVLGAAQMLLALNVVLSLWRVRSRVGMWLCAVNAAVAAGLIAAPVSVILVAWGVGGSPVAIGGITISAPFLTLPMAALLAVWAAWALTGHESEFGIPAASNPWLSNTLEWQISSPPPRNNYAVPPEVHYGPYEYSSPLTTDQDYLPQNRAAAGPVT